MRGGGEGISSTEGGTDIYQVNACQHLDPSSSAKCGEKVFTAGPEGDKSAPAVRHPG